MTKLARKIFRGSPLRSPTLRRLALDTGGSEIAEAAAVLPIMFMVLLGIFWFGQAFRLYGTITEAAQEGARAGAVPTCTTCTAGTTNVANAVTAVNNSLTVSHLDATSIPALSPAPVFNACVTGASTACQSTGTSNVCVQPNVQLSSTAGTPASAAGVCGIAVTFQYPYRFWLPFTSVNNQQILLTASARVRMETQ